MKTFFNFHHIPKITNDVALSWSNFLPPDVVSLLLHLPNHPQSSPLSPSSSSSPQKLKEGTKIRRLIRAMKETKERLFFQPRHKKRGVRERLRKKVLVLSAHIQHPQLL